jgi:hypothetical protein
VVVVQTTEDLANAMELEVLVVGQVMAGEGERSIVLGNMPAEVYSSPWSLQSLRTCFDDDDNEALLEAEVSIIDSWDEVLEKKAVILWPFFGRSSW